MTIPPLSSEKMPPSPSFEQALKALELIVRSLEGGKLSLEEALDAYERGIFYKNYCEDQLQKAKQRIDQVVLSSYTPSQQAQVIHKTPDSSLPVSLTPFKF